ncbi:recombinase family protein [Flavobacterium capsici]|uniref:Recombinase family protein n=1 Tax=Flavobacterium capsici TaxID=3075618 RepID=A0AA96J1P7_9FLAO|nr:MULTISPECIES: recombinase family protein [unclassified Flavobacterium]WNM18597.1 recombinase family protein [Flavobacterium sp. PMR2A8]WNM22648.1 recombinase family protein [Flavobacterium sp. PMTSA4]
MNKVAIYARVSTSDKQEYERQISDNTRAIYKEDYTEEQIEIFAEKLSGYNKERPELNRMMEIVRANPKAYDCIYVTEISRIGRNPRHTREVIDELSDLMIPVYVGTLGIKTIDNGKVSPIVSIILQVLMEFSHIEAEALKGRMISGKRQRAKDGKFTTHNIAYGYKSDENGFVVIDEIESEIVKLIFDKYQEGIGARVIAQSLNEMNVPTKFNKTRKEKVLKFRTEQVPIKGEDVQWSDTTIFQIIKNPIHYGKMKYKVTDAVTEIVNGKKVTIEPATYDFVDVEPIISKEQFDECNYLRENKIDRNYIGKHEYLLKDIMRCGVCGRKYLGKYIENKSNIYKCASYLKKGCGNGSINISLIESVIYDQVLNADTLLQYLDNPKDLLKTITSELEQSEQLLKNTNKQQADKEKQLENLIVAISKSKNPNFVMFEKLEGELNEEIKSLKEKIKLIRRDIISKKSIVENYNQELATKDMIMKSRFNRPELTAIFKQFIDKIVINQLDKDYILANVFIKVNGVRLESTLKLFIYGRGVRNFGGQNEKVYKYLPITKMENEPAYTDANFKYDKEKHLLENHKELKKLNGNILTVNVDDILDEFKSQMKFGIESDGFLGNKMTIIKKENYIQIDDCFLY